MKHLKIRGKLTLGFGFLLIILIVMNAFSLSNLRSISGLSVDLYTGPHMSAVSSVALMKDVCQIQNAADSMLLSGGSQLTDDYENARKNIQAELNAARKAGVIDAALITAFEQNMSALETSYAEIGRLLSENGQTQEEMKRFEAVLAESMTIAQEMAAGSEAKAEDFKDQAISQANRTIIIQDILFAVIVLAALLVSYKIAVIITVPLKKLSQGMRKFRRGIWKLIWTAPNRTNWVCSPVSSMRRCPISGSMWRIFLMCWAVFPTAIFRWKSNVNT